MIVKATYGQTLYDMGMQYYGCFDGAFCIIKLNAHMFLSYELIPGEDVVIDDEIPELTTDNRQVAAHYAANNIRVNSTYQPEVIPVGQFLPEDFTEDFVIE